MSDTSVKLAPRVRTSIVEITPEYAAFLLESNTKNRKLSERRVARYARMMSSGAWRLNGETIIVGSSGRLLNGQNRLSACVRAGKPFTTVFVDGVDDDAFDTLDTGRTRSGGDVLSIADIKCGGHVASSVRWAKTLSTNSLASYNAVEVTPHEVLAVVRSNPSLAELVQSAHARSKGGLIPAGLEGALQFLLSRQNPDLAAAFFSDIRTGVGLGEDSPAYAVRSRLLQAKMSKTRWDPREQAAVVIRGWNAFRAGRKITHIKGSVVGKDGKTIWPEIEQ